LVVLAVKPVADTPSVVVPSVNGTKVKPVPLLVVYAPTGIEPSAVPAFTPPLSSAPTAGVPLVAVTVSAPVIGLTGCGLSTVPPEDRAPTIALKGLGDVTGVALVGGPYNDTPDATVDTGMPLGEV
jgi:hypothetical protein